VVIRKHIAKGKGIAKDALGDAVLDRMEGSKKRNYYEGEENNSQSSSSSQVTPSAAFRLENKIPVERSPTTSTKRVKPNPAPPVRGNLLSASQIAEPFPTSFPLYDNLDSEDEEEENGEKEKEEKDEEDDDVLEVISFHI
jgi:hypothetical protein